MESLSYSPASTVPSLVGSSEYDEPQSRIDDDSSANYEEDQFESENEHDLAGAAAVSLNSSGSDKYTSDEFEDDQDACDIAKAALGRSQGVEQDTTEENDNDDESFEREDKLIDEQEDASPTVEDNKMPVKHAVGPQESEGFLQWQDGKNDDEVQPHDADELIPVLANDLEPQLGAWCSKKIHKLQTVCSHPEGRQPRVRKSEKALDMVPDGKVNNLIYRVRSARHPHRQHGNSWLHFRQKLKAPTSLLQRAQIQIWITTSCGESSTEKPRPDTPSTSVRSVAPTFCSVKSEILLGQLATKQLSDITKRWAAPDSGGFSMGTLDFVRDMAIQQRKVSAVGDATDESNRGRRLHRVMMTAQLHLEDSLGLRNQAAKLLGHLST